MNRFVEESEAARVDMVPRVIVGGASSAQSGSNLIEGLLTMLLSERMGVEINGNGDGAQSGQALQRCVLPFRRAISSASSRGRP